MNSIKQIAESWLGYPPAKPGEGSAWRFLIDKPWPSWIPNWLAFVGLIACVLVIIRVYQRDGARLPLRQLCLLIVMRLGLFALLLVFLTGVSVAIDRTSLPFIVVLLDSSASMSVDDTYQQNADKNIAKAATKSKAAPSRFDIARHVANESFLTRLLEDYRLRVYSFTDSARLVGRPQYVRGDDLSELSTLLNDVAASGAVTRPAVVLRELLDEFRGTPPSAVIMLSDGVASVSDQDRVIYAADDLAAQVVPVFAVGIGSEDPGRDLQLFDIQLDEIAIVDDPVIISAQVRGFGFDNVEVEAVVRDQATDEILTSNTIQTGRAGKSRPIELSWTPTRQGEFDLAIELQPLQGETNTANNGTVRHVSVREGRIRLLLVESVPRWEFRYIKSWFERQAEESRTIQIDTLLFDADPEFAALDKSARELNGRFPVSREALFGYDVIIFGDVDPAFLSSRSQENLRDFVREKGGGIVFVAGAMFNPVAYENSPLETLLPVQIASVKVPGPGSPIESFSPRRTLAGERGLSILRFADGETEQERVWSSLADLGWMVEAGEISPGAVSLLTHPNKNGVDGPLPVIVQQQYGAGKVIFHATDELWRWRKNAGDTYYGRYWTQLVRYLSRANLLGRDRGAELMSDRLIYKAGEPVLLRARFLDPELIPTSPAEVTVVLERRDGARQNVKLTPVQGANGVFEVRCEPGVGGFHAFIETPSFPDVAPSTDFRIEIPQLELQNRSLARSDLQQLAKTTRGEFYSPGMAEKIHDDLPVGRAMALESQKPVSLWNRWEFAVLFVALLSAEWIFRKRYRLI